jgi:hypothetical protein
MHGVLLLGSKFKKATNAIHVVKKITICNWVVHVHVHVSMTHHVNEPLVAVSMHSIYVAFLNFEPNSNTPCMRFSLMLHKKIISSILKKYHGT